MSKSWYYVDRLCFYHHCRSCGRTWRHEDCPGIATTLNCPNCKNKQKDLKDRLKRRRPQGE